MGWLSSLSEGAGSLIGGLASGIFGYKGTKDQNIASAQQAQNHKVFHERTYVVDLVDMLGRLVQIRSQVLDNVQ